MIAIERFLILVCLGLWWGGLTFYSAVVIPVGTEVLGGSEVQGTVTQQVTKWLNGIGVVAAAVLIWCVARYKWTSEIGRCSYLVFAFSTAGLTVLQAALYGLHHYLESILEQNVEQGVFYKWHGYYLMVVAAQWGLGVLIFLTLPMIWRHSDENKQNQNRSQKPRATSK